MQVNEKECSHEKYNAFQFSIIKELNEPKRKKMPGRELRKTKFLEKNVILLELVPKHLFPNVLVSIHRKIPMTESCYSKVIGHNHLNNRRLPVKQ